MSLFFKRSPSSILVRGSENVVFDVPWFTCHLVDGTQVILVRSSSPEDWEPTWVSGRVHFFAPSSLDCKVELTAFLLLLFFLFEEVRRPAPRRRLRRRVRVHPFKYHSSFLRLRFLLVCPSASSAPPATSRTTTEAKATRRTADASSPPPPPPPPRL